MGMRGNGEAVPREGIVIPQFGNYQVAGKKMR